MLRDAIKAGSPVGVRAKEFVEGGRLVPDDLMCEVVLSRLQEADCTSRGWLLDGFPRTGAQAKALVRAGIECDAFIQLEVPDELLLDRVTGRRLDPETGKIYHLKFFPPENEEVSGLLV
jgi:adenylate kinase